MLSRLTVRSIFPVILAAVLFVPAAQADDWGLDARPSLDPAIAAAIHDHPNLTSLPVTLDPAIQAAVFERSSRSARPDDRPGLRGAGSLHPSEPAPTGSELDWTTLGVGGGVVLAALLLAIGSLLTVRYSRTRVKSA
jgi:hypothetical protein